jgi:hypothetical protein
MKPWPRQTLWSPSCIATNQVQKIKLVRSRGIKVARQHACTVASCRRLESWDLPQVEKVERYSTLACQRVSARWLKSGGHTVNSSCSPYIAMTGSHRLSSPWLWGVEKREGERYYIYMTKQRNIKDQWWMGWKVTCSTQRVWMLSGYWFPG